MAFFGFKRKLDNRLRGLLFIHLLAVVLMVISVPYAYSAQLTLTWDEVEEPDIAGYRIYYSKIRGEYEHSMDAGNQTSYAFTELEGGDTYFFAITAYDTSGNESEIAEETFCFVDMDTDIEMDFEPACAPGVLDPA